MSIERLESLEKTKHYELNSDDLTYKATGKPGSIVSGGLGPCIAVGVFDRVKSRIYMIHEPNADSDQNIACFCEDVLKESASEDLDVWICGGGIDDDSDSIAKDRRYAEQTVKKKFIGSNIQIFWDEKNEGTELIINTDGDYYIDYKGYHSFNDNDENDYDVYL